MCRVGWDNIEMTSNKGDNFISFPGILDDHIASAFDESDSLKFSILKAGQGQYIQTSISRGPPLATVYGSKTLRT